MCKDTNTDGVIGIAWVGTLCGSSSLKSERASLNEKRSTVVATAEVTISQKFITKKFFTADL